MLVTVIFHRNHSRVRLLVVSLPWNHEWQVLVLQKPIIWEDTFMSDPLPILWIFCSKYMMSSVIGTYLETLGPHTQK